MPCLARRASASSKQSDTKDAQHDHDSRLYQIRCCCSVAPNEKKRAISPGHQLREEQHDRVGNQSPDEPAGLSQDRGRRHRGGVEPAPAGGRCREDHHHPARKLVHQALRRVCAEHAGAGLREGDRRQGRLRGDQRRQPADADQHDRRDRLGRRHHDERPAPGDPVRRQISRRRRYRRGGRQGAGRLVRRRQGSRVSSTANGRRSRSAISAS